ncbi:hypothetical protein F4803DRAFT_553385 [Xylaria telfairii]|nr:hypothetical protein F4803DRAFT_553385 [Xylaria telfairii]
MPDRDVFDDLSWEYGEKEVDGHGFWKLGISKTVHANVQAFSSSTASDFLGPESHLRASGNGPNKQLRLIPFISVIRPGTLTYIKQRLHDPTVAPMTATEISKLAAERRDQWLAGGPWLPPDFLATWSESLNQALAKAHATLVREKMTQNQFFVAAVWWAHYVLNPDRHRDFGSVVPAAQVPRLMNFVVQVMATLRSTDKFGLAFIPNLARASKIRHNAETSIADSSQIELEV